MNDVTFQHTVTIDGKQRSTRIELTCADGREAACINGASEKEVQTLAEALDKAGAMGTDAPDFRIRLRDASFTAKDGTERRTCTTTAIWLHILPAESTVALQFAAVANSTRHFDADDVMTLEIARRDASSEAIRLRLCL